MDGRAVWGNEEEQQVNCPVQIHWSSTIFSYTSLYPTIYLCIYDGVSNHRAQQNCMPRQELCSISIIIILAGWLVGHATCIELYCEHNARLSSLSSSSSSYLDTVLLLLVAVVHGGGTGGVRRRRPPRMHRLFQSPAKSWRIVKASLLSATTSLGRLLHHYICNLLCKYFATVLVLRCCSGSVPSPLRSSPVSVQLLHSGR